MTRIPSDVAAFVLVALCIVAITVLAVVGTEIPDVLVTIALVSVGAGGGAALPRKARTAPPVAPPAGVGVITP